jgi:lycopene cyclase domain-containing protein
MTGRWTYLAHLLVWTLPLLLGQAALLRWRYGADTGRVLAAVLPPALVITLWLVAADHLAIDVGIWRFAPDLHLGVRLGAVPIEEALFFLITNLLVAFGLALLAPERAR